MPETATPALLWKSLFKKYDSSSKIIKEINKKRIDDANIYLSTFEDYLKDIVNKKRESTLPIISLDKGLTTTGLEVYQKNILMLNHLRKHI